MPGVRIEITNELERKEEEMPPGAGDEQVPTHMTFNRSTIEELSQEDSLEYDDGALSDDPFPSESQAEERIPNGGTPSPSYM